MFNELVERTQLRWGHTEELLVHLCELVDALVRVTVAVNSEKGKAPRVGPPFEYPRPGAPNRPKASDEVMVMRPAELGRRMLMGGGA